jgi:hypothetical protein
MPTNKPRVNVTISKAAHSLAKALAERDSRTISLLVEFLLKKYAEERGWNDLLAAVSLPASSAPDAARKGEKQVEDPSR